MIEFPEEPHGDDQVGPGFALPLDYSSPPSMTRTLRVSLPAFPGTGSTGPTLVVTQSTTGYNGNVDVHVEGVINTKEEYNAVVGLISHFT